MVSPEETSEHHLINKKSKDDVFFSPLCTNIHHLLSSKAEILFLCSHTCYALHGRCGCILWDHFITVWPIKCAEFSKPVISKRVRMCCSVAESSWNVDLTSLERRKQRFLWCTVCPCWWGLNTVCSSGDLPPARESARPSPLKNPHKGKTIFFILHKWKHKTLFLEFESGLNWPWFLSHPCLWMFYWPLVAACWLNI